MSSTVDNILLEIGKLRRAVLDLEARLMLAPNQIKITTVSDLSSSLGLIQAGEYRSGNSVQPGFGFTGIRIGYPGFTYTSNLWNLAGVASDVLQVGIKATDGKLYAGAGAVILDANGITLEAPSAFANPNAIKFSHDGVDYVTIWLNKLTGVLGIYNVGDAASPAAMIDITARAYGTQSGAVQLYGESTGAGTPSAEMGTVVNSGTGGHWEMVFKAQTADESFNLTDTNTNYLTKISASTSLSTVWNETGLDIDFRIESDTNANAFVLDAGLNAIGIMGAVESGWELKVTGDFKATGNADIGGTLAMTGVATFTGNPVISNTAPSLQFSDTTASAKDLTIAIDANKAEIRESADAAGTLLTIDLSNHRLGIVNSSPGAALHVQNSTGIQIQTGGWAQMSSGDGGVGWFGGNMYSDWTPNSLKFASTHAAIGAIGFAVNYPNWNQAAVVSSGGTSSTAGSTITPSTIAVFDYAGNVGIGTTTLNARLNAYQSSLGSEVLRLESTATNDDPVMKWVQGRVATTDATVTTILTVAIPASTTVYVDAKIVARRTGGTSGSAEDGGGYSLDGVWKNVAGTATNIGGGIMREIETTPGYTVSTTQSGGNALIQVKGVASTNITWHCTAEVTQVSS